MSKTGAFSALPSGYTILNLVYLSKTLDSGVHGQGGSTRTSHNDRIPSRHKELSQKSRVAGYFPQQLVRGYADRIIVCIDGLP